MYFREVFFFYEVVDSFNNNNVFLFCLNNNNNIGCQILFRIVLGIVCLVSGRVIENILIFLSFCNFNLLRYYSFLGYSDYIVSFVLLRGCENVYV